jgi:hypothetical protein
MIVECGLEVPVGPYGGDYWRVEDPPAKPPAGSAFPSMSLHMDYGAIELVDADTLHYVSERGPSSHSTVPKTRRQPPRRVQSPRATEY